MNVTKALEYLYEARESHVLWRDHLRWHEDNPDLVCEHCASTKTGEAFANGRWDSAQEQMWIDRYDNIISVVLDLSVKGLSQ